MSRRFLTIKKMSKMKVFFKLCIPSTAAKVIWNTFSGDTDSHPPSHRHISEGCQWTDSQSFHGRINFT